MAGYVACVAGVEKMWGIGPEGKKGVSLVERVSLFRAFRAFLPLSLSVLSFAPARQAVGYVGMCRSTGYGFCPSGSETAYKNHHFISFISSQKSLIIEEVLVQDHSSSSE